MKAQDSSIEFLKRHSHIFYEVPLYYENMKLYIVRNKKVKL